MRCGISDNCAIPTASVTRWLALINRLFPERLQLKFKVLYFGALSYCGSLVLYSEHLRRLNSAECDRLLVLQFNLRTIDG